MNRRRLAALLARVASGRSALQIVAHPDDEDAGALVWLAHVAAARTALVSLTRGESGANVVGPEVGRHLGLRRTAELVAAASVYGVDAVHLTSAPDYGFSRRLDEAWARWDRAGVLAELVAIIRRERPTVILSRFFGGPGDGHAHHQAAGLLAREAAVLAASADALPALGAPWRALRVYAGEVPAGERVDAILDASAPLDGGDTCLAIANAGYAHHETQDPQALFDSGVDHRVARYQCIDGPLAAGEPVFGGLPATPSALLASSLEVAPGEEVAARLDAAARLAGSARQALDDGDDDALRASVRDARAIFEECDAADADPALTATVRADLDEALGHLEGRPRRLWPLHDLPGPPELPAISVEPPDWILVDVAATANIVVGNRSSASHRVAVEARGSSSGGDPVEVELAPGEARRLELPLPDGLGGSERVTFHARAGAQELSIGRVVDVATPLGLFRVVEPAATRALRARAALRPGLRVAFVPGPSSIAARALEALGLELRVVDMDDWPASAPDDVDALLVGERAFAASGALRQHAEPLRELCDRGVHVVVLSQTPEFDPGRHAPVAAVLPLDAEEVCEEDSPVMLLAPDHQLLASPNRIEAADFDDWFDARGAKFFSSWDAAYEPLVELCDPGRTPQRGVWLTARVGAGRFTYCALAIERQLVAGVPGGFRLLANLVSAR